MTIDEAIKDAEENIEEYKELYRLCPASESDIFHCDGTKDCRILKIGKNKGCLKLAEEHKQLVDWLEELKQLREQTRLIPISERPPEIHQDVILSLRSLDIKVGYRAETEPYFYCYGEDGCYIDPQNVIAWAPLPEPMKVESE